MKLALAIGLLSHLQTHAEVTNVTFSKHHLTDKYISEGASVADLDADGHLDLIAGSLWWKGPDFKQSFSYAAVQYFPIQGPGLSGYAKNFFTFPLHLSEDKWPEILAVGLPGDPAHTFLNPGKTAFPNTNTEHSCAHCKALDSVCNESPQLIDIQPKGPKHLLSFQNNHLTLSHPGPTASDPWQVINITPNDGAFHKYSHGLGAADINGDKLTDILEKRGWWEQPKDWDHKTLWKFHPYPFSSAKGGSQMFAYDLDGDGDNDVVTALDAHGYGLNWYEQERGSDGNITFKTHVVMTDKPEGNPYGVSFSQPHAMACADIDNDGIKDIITGKCYFAHNGKDPGAHDPAVLYWFRTTRHKDGTTELVPHLIDSNSGVGRQVSCADLNADGKLDIITSNKKGVFLFIQN